jgi:hypothetical protein
MLVPFTFLLWVLCAVGIVDAQNYPITGVKVAAGQPVPYRKNINQLRNEGGPAWYVPSPPLILLFSVSSSSSRDPWSVSHHSPLGTDGSMFGGSQAHDGQLIHLD